jgi:hypothetical protein
MNFTFIIPVFLFVLLIAYSMYCFTRIGMFLRRNKGDVVDFSRAYEIPFKMLFNDKLVVQYLLKGIICTIVAFLCLLPLLLIRW